jgi:hypothetical protein
MSVEQTTSTPLAMPTSQTAQPRGKSRWAVFATVAFAVGWGLLKLGLFALHAHAWVNVVRLFTGHPH